MDIGLGVTDVTMCGYYPANVLETVVGDSDNPARIVKPRVNTINQFPIIKINNFYVANILSRWCVFSNDINNASVIDVDLYQFSKLLKKNALLESAEFRRYFRDMFVFTLFSTPLLKLKLDLPKTEKIALHRLLQINASLAEYATDQLSFVEFNYDYTLQSIRCYPTDKLVLDKNHFKYDYIADGDSKPRFSLYIKGNQVIIICNKTAFLYVMPIGLFEDYILLHKLNIDNVYPIVLAMFNYIENNYCGEYSEFDKSLINNHSVLVREGIKGYYARMKKDAAKYFSKGVESDIYPFA